MVAGSSSRPIQPMLATHGLRWAIANAAVSQRACSRRETKKSKA